MEIGLITMCLQVFGRFSDDFSVLNKIYEKFCEKRLTIAVFWRVLEKLRKFAYFRVGGGRGGARRAAIFRSRSLIG